MYHESELRFNCTFKNMFFPELAKKTLLNKNKKKHSKLKKKHTQKPDFTEMVEFYNTSERKKFPWQEVK